jgi:hypothetical protein
MTWQRCDVCNHPSRPAIEKSIRKAKSLAFVAERYGMSAVTLTSHRDEHMASLPSVTTGEATVVHSRMDPTALFEEHNECIREAKALIDYCRNGEFPDTKGWALGVREWRGCLDQKNKMLGLYDQVDPRLQRAFAARVIEVVSRALEQFPDARMKVLAAIDDVEKGGPDGSG